MVKLFLPVIFLLHFLFSTAQKTDEDYSPVNYKTTFCKSSFLTVPLSGERNEKNVVHFLVKHIANLQHPNTALRLNYINESPGGFHYSFVQTLNGVEIYQTEIKLNLDRNNTVRSILDNSENTLGWNLNMNSQTNNPVIVIHPDTRQPVLAERFIEDYSTEFIIANGEIIFQRDMNSYLAPPDSLVNGKIFNPDPLTTAGQVYNVSSQYKDNNDSNAVWLDAQLQTVNFIAKYNDSTNLFTLESPYVRLRDFDGPPIAPVSSSIPEFYFNRSQTGFEDVNAFYHISVMQNHIQTLGFNCADQLVEVDPHGLSADNSIFYPAPSPKRIAFGIGGVDDAEDADVCIHEYAHFVSETASPGSNVGSQRNALDEGFGDYLAASYSTSINTFNRQWVYNWDGHNEFWNGRSVNSSKVYPHDTVSSIYRNGEMWSSALMKIYDEIGRAATDSLILQTHYSYAQNMTMGDAGLLMIDADTLLTNGKYHCPVYKHLLTHGFVPFYANNPCGISSVTDISESLIGFISTPAFFEVSAGSGETFSVEVLTVNGQQVFFADNNHTHYRYQNGTLSQGLYLVNIKTDTSRKTFKWFKAN